jgi:hypothetical protein
MTQNSGEQNWIGKDLFASGGERIGAVAGVRYGDVAGAPAWLIVDTGTREAPSLYVPAHDVRVSGDRLSLPYAKERVKGAPAIEGGPTLSDSEQATLCRYYGLVHTGGPGTAEGCDDMPDVRPAG